MRSPRAADSAGEIALFVQLARHGNLTRAARAMGVTPAALSKRLAQLEQRLDVRLVHRTTRSFSLTGEGRLYLEKGSAVLLELERLEQALSTLRDKPTGLLRVNAPLNFGRVRVAPVIPELVAQYPELEVDLDLSDHPRDLVEGGFDVAIRMGTQPDSGLHARRLASNRRYLCASPDYLARHGTPQEPADLAGHQCIVVRRMDAPFGIWNFVRDGRVESVRVGGHLTCNDGEVALNWALAHQGIMMRSGWDIARLVRAGQLRIVLPRHPLQPRDVFAVFPDSGLVAPKARVFIDFMARMLGDLDDIDDIDARGLAPQKPPARSPGPSRRR